MPVVAASRFEGHVGKGHLLRRHACQIAVALEVFCISRVRFADGENHFALEGCLGVIALHLVGPHLLGLAESRPSLGPSGIEGHVGDDFADFGACDAVALRLLQVVGERGVSQSLADECRDSHEAAVAQAEQVVAAPHLAEEHVVVELGKLRCKFAELRASGGLDNLFLCHRVECE